MNYTKEAVKLLRKYNFDMDDIRPIDIQMVANCIKENGLAFAEKLIKLGVEN